MYPGVDIEFQNGAIGGAVQLSDGIFGVVASADAVGTTFVLNTPYSVRTRKAVADLGITDTVGNHRLYKFIDEFFNEAGEGSELWIMGVPKTVGSTPTTFKVSDWFTADATSGEYPVQKLLDKAKGAITGIFTVFDQGSGYTPTITDGLDADVMVAVSKAQIYANNYTSTKHSPFFVVVEGYAFNGKHADLPNLENSAFNRVGILIGDTESRTGTYTSNGAAVGLLAGRAAKNRVHEKIAKVRDGALTANDMFIVSKDPEEYDVESIHNKGFITFRTHPRKSGYYFVDDHLATSTTDDYAFLVRRRVIDKAYRIAYDTIVTFLQDDYDTNADGTLMLHEAKTMEGAVQNAIFLSMTTNGELSFDPQNKDDKGVVCQVDLTHNVTSTNQIKLTGLQIKPKGYGSLINVPLGFVPVTNP